MKYKFRLAPLLRLKKIEKDKELLKLGLYLKKINEHKYEIKLEEHLIQEALVLLEKNSFKNKKMIDLKFDPKILKIKLHNISLHESGVEEIQKEIKSIMSVINRYEGEIKNLEKIEARDKKKYIKKVEKKQEEKREEQYQILRFYKT